MYRFVQMPDWQAIPDVTSLRNPPEWIHAGLRWSILLDSKLDILI
jgi:hypothetical protein